MKCPNCPDAALVMSDRQGVEIDYCPSCRGVWLDRGELDKIIERSGRESDSTYASRLPLKKKSKTKSLLGEIFDF